jgi:hypothetical protein
MRRGGRKTQQPDEPLDDEARGADRRRVAKLAAVAVAGAVVGTEALSAPATAATLATVRGKVSGPGVTDFSQCVVFLYETTGTSKPHMKPVSATGHYQIGNVPPGKWRAICVVDAGTPLATMTYKGKPGYHYTTGTVITITGAQTVYANFALPPAGVLAVIVMNQSAVPVSGAYVWNFEALTEVATATPVITDVNGIALLGNVPLTSKVLIFDPATKVGVWWDGAQSWATATAVALPAQGEGISISATLPEG